MKTLQPGVLAPVAPAVRYLTFSLKPRANPLRSFAALVDRLLGNLSAWIACSVTP